MTGDVQTPGAKPEPTRHPSADSTIRTTPSSAQDIESNTKSPRSPSGR
ncbi:hypothetical protein [Streptomyces sp. WAC 06783]|nr:hypothetical protein [Streptomyces sp. WAC 06783]